jgi:hypothetical protein
MGNGYTASRLLACRQDGGGTNQEGDPPGSPYKKPHLKEWLRLPYQ